METINLILKSYNMKNCQDELVKKCIKDNPSLYMHQIAYLLGMSKTMLSRYCDRLGITFHHVSIAAKKRSSVPEYELELIPRFKK